MDYLTIDFAPNIMRFIKATIGGKNTSYYNFLKKMEEESLSIFSDEEVIVIEKLSSLLPLVRLDEFMIIKNLIEGRTPKEIIGDTRITIDTYNNAMYYLIKDGLINEEKLAFNLNDDLFKSHINDILEYSINRYNIEFGSFDGTFKHYGNYQKDQIMKVLLEESSMYMQGAKYNLKKKETYLFVGLKKDKTKEELHNYKDKFISNNIIE